MLEARSSTQDRALEGVKLVLRLKRQNSSCPERLKQHFIDVLTQSFRLISDPRRYAAETSPEAVVLAVRLATDADLRQVFQEILDKQSASETQAERALQSLERFVDAGNKSEHIGAEIYASI